VVVAAAATGILSLYATPGFADSNANGAATDSPGVASGNNVQVPVHVPVNACGNTVNVIAALNPAFGNSCANRSSSSPVQGASSSGSSAHGVAYDSPGVLSGNTAQAPVDVPVNACGNAVDVIGVLNPAFGNQCANEGQPTPPPPTPPVTVPPRVTPPATVPPRVTPPTTPPRVTPPATVPPRVTPPATVPPRVTPPTTPVTAPPPLRNAHPAIPPNTPSLTGQEQPPGAPPTLARTGSEDVLAASAASVALLAGGALLYRRGRAASRR
jgi:hypothetical protein